jgi:hypothetical protein
VPKSFAPPFPLNVPSRPFAYALTRQRIPLRPLFAVILFGASKIPHPNRSRFTPRFSVTKIPVWTLASIVLSEIETT